MIFLTTIPIPLPSGGRLEIDVSIDAAYCPAEGNGWDGPRLPESWELDGYIVTGATWLHPDGERTEFRLRPGCLMGAWLELFLDKRPGLLAEALDEVLLLERR